MRILLPALELPYPPNDGGRIRLYKLLSLIAEHHKITLVAFRQKPDAEGIAHLARTCEDVLTVQQPGMPARPLAAKLHDLPRRRPIALRAYFSQAMADVLRDLIQDRQFDLVHADHIYLAQYRPLFAHLPGVLTHYDVEAEKQQRELRAASRCWSSYWSLRWLEFLRWRRYELEASRAFDALVTVSARNAEYFTNRVPGKPVGIVCNGVDTDYFRPIVYRTQQPVLIFSGAMRYAPNVEGARWLVERVMPVVWQVVPTAQVLIVGRDPTSEVAGLNGHPRVTVTGTVEDVRSYYAESAVALVPLHLGSGTRLKVLEAMAIGVPVVSTRVGYEGLDLLPDQDLLVADTAQDFAQQILALLRNPGLGDKLAQHARATVQSNYSWSRSADALLALYDDTVKQFTRSS